MQERLQKILSARGVASRRGAEELISQGRVVVNGAVAALGQTADAAVDQISIDGKPLPATQRHIYIMLHKPRGYVTTLSDEKGRRDVSQLVSNCGSRVYPVGRLDMDSEGLLLLTNDGEFAHKLMHPKHQVDKTYHVFVEHYTPDALHSLGQSVTLDGYTIKKPEVKLLGANGACAKLAVTIHEGRNRQVRRMCSLAGLHVTRLIRVSEGSLTLGDLPKGKWRYLTAEEINSLSELQ